MTVADVMTKNPVYINPDMSVNDVKALMTKEGVGRFPVLDKNDNLVGIVTKKDLIKAAPSSATTLDMYEISYLLSKLTVEKIMEKNVTVVQESEVVEEAARIMADKDINCLPVMRGNLLTGIVTVRDLFATFVDMFGARHRGVRASFSLDEKPGQIAHFAKAIADLNGNIVSLVTAEGEDVKHRRCTIKVSDIAKDDLIRIIKDIGAVLEDIR
jgi:CBS domain protein